MAIRATLLALLFACKPPEPPPAAQVQADKPRGAEACMDAELARRNLDQYGGEQGTMYPGGTPLFQESTGKRTDRAQYVYGRHPDIAALCSGADAGR